MMPLLKQPTWCMDIYGLTIGPQLRARGIRMGMWRYEPEGTCTISVNS